MSGEVGAECCGEAVPNAAISLSAHADSALAAAEKEAKADATTCDTEASSMVWLLAPHLGPGDLQASNVVHTSVGAEPAKMARWAATYLDRACTDHCLS